MIVLIAEILILRELDFSDAEAVFRLNKNEVLEANNFKNK